MKQFPLFRRGLAAVLTLLLVCALPLSASAFFWDKKEEVPAVADFTKNGLVGDTIAFSPQDFAVESGADAVLSHITLVSLPDPGAGSLTMGGQALTVGTVIDATALEGLRFQSAQNPTVTTTSFTFTPAFSSSSAQPEDTTVTLYLLTAANEAPIARNMDLSTYRNVAITGYFDAVDGEGDTLTFQLTDTPARGSVELSEDGGKTWSDMSPIEQNYGDRWIRGYHIGVEHHPTESGTSPCYHQYQYKLKDAAATAIEVRATDSFGHVYTQDTFTADNDFTEAEKY